MYVYKIILCVFKLYINGMLYLIFCNLFFSLKILFLRSAFVFVVKTVIHLMNVPNYIYPPTDGGCLRWFPVFLYYK